MSTNNSSFKGTPFNSRTEPLNLFVRWIAWDIYHVVDVFSGLDDELKAIRAAVAVIDMSPLSKFDISGPDAARFTNYIITRDARKMEVNQVFYTPWCDHDGKVVSDGMVFRMSEDRFRITGDPSHGWLMQNAEGFDIRIKEVTHERGILSLQGPKSRAVLEAATGEDWSGFRFSRIRIAEIGGVDVEVARQGFTGERGYELCVAEDNGAALWDAIMEAGDAHGIKPAGYLALDTARIEAGLIIPGPDFTNGGAVTDAIGAPIEVDSENKASPFELGAGRFVDFDSGDFLGKAALLKEIETGFRRNRVGLQIDWQGIAEMYTAQGLAPVVVPTPIWYPLVVMKDGKKIGRATSIAWSPTIQKVIGFGHLEKEYCEPDTEVAVEFHVKDKTGLVNARVVKLPFIDLRRTQ